MTSTDDPTDPDQAPGDELPADAANAGEDVCPRCGGSGTAEGGGCPDCRGTGRVQTAVGGG